MFAVIEFIQKLLSTSYSHVMKISQSDIGVVTPYKMQRRKIAQACLRFGYADITVGTAEAFQGQEKAVIIVSTVRSGGSRLGFVNNARVSTTLVCFILVLFVFHFYDLMTHFNYYSQRFNVMITRAKSLLVIVGDPHSLQHDANWNKLIGYCLENNAMVQSLYRFPY